MAAAIFRLGRLEGIDRPALPAYFLTPSGPLVLLDVGANVDSEPRNLVQFGAMGSLYAERVLHVDKPRVGLLNIGEEPEKGDALSREAFIQFGASDLNFVGNVEPHELASSPADVVVCDGFVGNVVLKLTEGLTSYIFRSIREDLLRGPVAPIAVLALRPGIDRLRHRFDYEQFGGSPLLGVRGVSIVTHGRAKARMVENAIRVGSEAAAANIPAEIADWSRRHPNLYGEPTTDGGTADPAGGGREGGARGAGHGAGRARSVGGGPRAAGPAGAPAGHGRPVRSRVPVPAGGHGARAPGRRMGSRGGRRGPRPNHYRGGRPTPEGARCGDRGAGAQDTGLGAWSDRTDDPPECPV